MWQKIHLRPSETFLRKDFLIEGSFVIHQYGRTFKKVCSAVGYGICNFTWGSKKEFLVATARIHHSFYRYLLLANQVFQKLLKATPESIPDFSQQTFPINDFFHFNVSDTQPRRWPTSRLTPVHLVFCRPPLWGNRSRFLIHLQLIYLMYMRDETQVFETMVFAALFSTFPSAQLLVLLTRDYVWGLRQKCRYKLFSNSLATGITYCFTRGISSRPIRFVNAPSPLDPYWSEGEKRLHWEFELFFARFDGQNENPSVCLVLFTSVYLFANDDTDEDLLLWLIIVASCDRIILVGVSWKDGWKLLTEITTASCNFQLREWEKWQSLERSTLETERMTTTTTVKAKIVGCCSEVSFVCLNCNVKFVLPRIKKGMGPPVSFRRAMVNEWIEDFKTRRHWFFGERWMFLFEPNQIKQSL